MCCNMEQGSAIQQDRAELHKKSNVELHTQIAELHNKSVVQLHLSKAMLASYLHHQQVLLMRC